MNEYTSKLPGASDYNTLNTNGLEESHDTEMSSFRASNLIDSTT